MPAAAPSAPQIPPPVLALACLAAQAVLARGAGRRDYPGRREVTGGLAVAALVVSSVAARSFAAHHTTIDARTPEQASTLVTAGVYAHSRNPMYVGLLCLLTAFAAWAGRTRCLLPVVAFGAWLDRVQVPAEEAALAVRFGPVYDAYRARTRRWL